MNHLEYWGIIAILLFIIIVQQTERKDLYNRIMAGNLQDYKAAEKPRKSIRNIIKQNLEKNSGKR